MPWLWMLRQPTLILAGTDDPLVPVTLRQGERAGRGAEASQ